VFTYTESVKYDKKTSPKTGLFAYSL